MKRLIQLIVNVLLTITAIAYPILWLWGKMPHILWYFPYILAILWGVKACFQHKEQSYFSCLMTFVLAFVGWTRSLETLYWYPVIMNGLMLAIFASSLFQAQTVVERLARLQTPNLTPKAVQYTRRVTQIWCAVFCVNIVLSTLFIALNKLEYWAIYTGVISYIIMGLVMSIEWLIRQRVKRYHYE